MKFKFYFQNNTNQLVTYLKEFYYLWILLSWKSVYLMTGPLYVRVILFIALRFSKPYVKCFRVGLLALVMYLWAVQLSEGNPWHILKKINDTIRYTALASPLYEKDVYSDRTMWSPSDHSVRELLCFCYIPCGVYPPHIPLLMVLPLPVSQTEPIWGDREGVETTVLVCSSCSEYL